MATTVDNDNDETYTIHMYGMISRSPKTSFPTPFSLRFMHLPNQINNDEFV